MRRHLLLALIPAMALAADPPPEARRWWSHVQVLAADGMEGRDTGTEGYRRASRYVAGEFERAGLRPLGESGYYQPVPLRDLRVDPAASSFELVRDGVSTPLRLNHQIGITPRTGLPGNLDAPLVFAGYGKDFAGLDLKGKIVVTFAGTAATISRAIGPLGAVGVIAIDNPRALETPRWPIAYARVMSFDGRPRVAAEGVSMRLNSDAADEILKRSGHTWAEILELGSAGKPLPSFPLMGTLRAKISLRESTVSSDNLIAVLPGSDPVLKDEYVLVSAHLDGYGFGEPVNGDGLYNGAFDDAACVANLIELAADLKRSGRKLHRSLLFAVYTGEEKGLLGSDYFVSHLTVPKEKIVANINLDYIRPIFPLTILTTLGLEESTLGKTAVEVAKPLGIRIQTDNEPERGLFRRSDQYNFIRNGVPGIAFIFGYEKGSKEEAIYRAWYRERYHKPQDDLQQPVDFAAAVKFHQFFSAMAEAVADAPERPTWSPSSQYGR